MWTYIWMAFWPLSFVLGLINIFVALKGTGKATVVLASLSLFSALFGLLSFLAQVNTWVFKNDWSALLDVVPGLYNIFAVAALLCGVLNAAAVIILLRRKK